MTLATDAGLNTKQHLKLKENVTQNETKQSEGYDGERMEEAHKRIRTHIFRCTT